MNFGGLNWRDLLKRTWKQCRQDRVVDQSAKLSFYFLLSIFPLLLFLMALLGLLLGSDAKYHDLLHKYLGTVLPESASHIVDRTLHEVTAGSSGTKVSFGLLITLWAASKGMLATIGALNVAYEIVESRPWWRKQAVALGLTVVFIVLMGAAVLLIVGANRVPDVLVSWFGFSAVIAGVWQVVEWLVLLACVLLAFNILYVYAPNVKHKQWHWLMPGTVVGVVLWLAVSFGFKIYLGYFNRYTVTYGSIGAVIILVLWFYLTGIAILVGAEVNSEIEKASGRVKMA